MHIPQSDMQGEN